MLIDLIVDRFNVHLSLNRRRYFWGIVNLALISLVLFFYLVIRNNVPEYITSNFGTPDWEKFFYATWAVLSIVLGSVVFIQIQEKKVYHTFDSFMDALIGMIKETPRYDHIYILTPNVSLGQTRHPKQFLRYQEALDDAITNRGCIVHFSIWNLSAIEQASKLFPLSSDQKTEENERHLQYIEKLFKESLSRGLGNAKEKRREMFWLQYEYNEFVKFLEGKKECVKWHLAGECGDENLFFLFYNKKRIFVSSCNRIGLISGESIESEGFISSIQEVILHKYFS